MKNILIIDDNKDTLTIFKQLLLDEGYRVSTANNGATGVILFMRQSFDLVITDLNMPEMNGLDVINDAKHLGVNAVISKTIDDYDFCELVKYCMEDKVYESKVF